MSKNPTCTFHIKAASHDPIFRIRFLLKFKEVTDVKQHFYELKQCQLKKTDSKLGSCEPARME